MNPFLRFFIRFLKIFIRSLFRATIPTEHHCTQNGSTPPEQIGQRSRATSEPAPTAEQTTEPQSSRKRRHRRTSVTETTTRTTTISESQSSPDLALAKNK